MFSTHAGIAGLRDTSVERQLADAVDGIVGVIDYFGHAVLSTLHDHTAAEDAHEVGTLQRVQQTAGIDGTETTQFPVSLLFVGHVVVVLRCYTLVQGYLPIE